jgi:Family of unknown function (DUF6029)
MRRALGRAAGRAHCNAQSGVAWALAAPVAVAVLTIAPLSARAEPVRLDVTETAVGAAHGNNRDGLVDNDDYGEWLDRLDVQLTWWRLSAGLRLDSAVYFAPPTPEVLASNAVAPSAAAANCQGETLADCYDRQLLEYDRALLNRYRATIYPSKVYLTYAGPSTEVTVGDFYAQFGRGLTLSVRKLDELSYDTTIRGAKADWSWRNRIHRLGATLLAGVANPIRVDEISGRQLTAPESWAFAGMPTFDPNDPYGPADTETFRPDGILGARVEGGSDRVLVGAYASLVARGGLSQIVGSDDLQTVAFRDANPARQVKYLETGSGSISLPSLGDSGAAYLEVAGQRYDPASTLFGPTPAAASAITGYAVASSLSFNRDRVQALLEIRHTRRFSPLMANVDVSRASEFSGVQYSAPPTTEPITTDTEFNLFAYCTSGGRARIDYRATDHVVVYGSLGAYRTWSERLGDCDAHGGGLPDADRNDVWDPLAGVTITYDQNNSRANLWGGVRVDDMAVPMQMGSAPPSTEYYREVYLRYDALHTISSRWALQLEGTHRARSEPQTDAASWVEGENYTAVHWSSTVIASFGYEYTTRYDRRLSYFNGSLFYRFPRRWLSQDSSIRLFAGQQRGALRCINGICKVFPDFTGARIELVLRF